MLYAFSEEEHDNHPGGGSIDPSHLDTVGILFLCVGGAAVVTATLWFHLSQHSSAANKAAENKATYTVTSCAGAFLAFVGIAFMVINACTDADSANDAPPADEVSSSSYKQDNGIAGLSTPLNVIIGASSTLLALLSLAIMCVAWSSRNQAKPSPVVSFSSSGAAAVHASRTPTAMQTLG